MESIFFGAEEEKIMRVHAVSPVCGLRVVVCDDYFPKDFPGGVYSALSTICATTHDYDMLTEAASFDEVDEYYNPGEEVVPYAYILEAITVDRFSQTEHRMNAVVRTLNKHLKGNSENITALPAIVGKPKKSGSFAYVTVQLPFSDGQVVSVVFHAPEGDKRKIAPNDTIIAFRWILNKRDITQVVAPEDGSEVSLETIGVRLSQLVVKNAGRFARMQKDAQEKRKQLEDVRENLKEAETKQTDLMDNIVVAQQDLETIDAKLSNTLALLEKQKAINAELEAKLDALRKAEADRVVPPATNTDQGNGSSAGTNTENPDGAFGAEGSTLRFYMKGRGGFTYEYRATNVINNTPQERFHVERQDGNYVQILVGKDWRTFNEKWLFSGSLFNTAEEAKNAAIAFEKASIDAVETDKDGNELNTATETGQSSGSTTATNNGDPNKEAENISNATNGVVSSEEVLAQKNTISGWVDGIDFDSLKKDKPSREEIFKKFSTTPKPIATLPLGYLNNFAGKTDDPRIYCSEAYFVDHAVNHHAELDVEEYKRIQDVIAHPDSVKRDTRTGVRSSKTRDALVFIKQYDSNRVVAISLEKDSSTENKIVFHKTMFETSKKNPYTSLPDVRIVSVDGAPSEEGVPTIGVNGNNPVPGGSRLSARDGNTLPETGTGVNTPDTQNPNSDGDSGSSETPSFVNTLNDILAGKYDQNSSLAMDALEAALNEAAAAGKEGEYADLIDQASNHITDLLTKEAQ
ncbi:MAG: hypothetical protein IJU76_14180 [Desulfovibrionaceae bacterium]|nr:hypothetical protein [Desulfovibrionaceae bacterium]